MLLDAKLHSKVKKLLLILPETFRGCTDRHGEHYCDISIQINKYEKSYCALHRHTIFL